MDLEETTSGENLVVIDRLRACSASVSNSCETGALRTVYIGHLVRSLMYGN